MSIHFLTKNYFEGETANVPRFVKGKKFVYELPASPPSAGPTGITWPDQVLDITSTTFLISNRLLTKMLQPGVQLISRKWVTIY